MKHNMEIIYEDREIVVCHKMPGIPVQTAKTGQQDMVSMLRNYFAGKKEPTDIFIVHRLDQPVEGVMVFARTKAAAAALSRQVQEKSMDKYYLALAEGNFAEPSGVLKDYLLRDGKTNTSKVVPKGTKGAKEAKLFYEVKKVVTDPEKINSILGRTSPETIWQAEVMKRSEEVKKLEEMLQQEKVQQLSLVSVCLETGRHHQIRVQMAHAGHPLAGDKKYNKNCPSGYMPVGLCSVKTTFCHPATGKQMEFTVEPKGKLFNLFQ